jgi:TPR repeat protein
MLNYELCLLECEGVNKNVELVFSWYKQSAELGNSYGMDYYGICLLEGEYVNKNVELEVYWFQQSAELGNTN